MSIVFLFAEAYKADGVNGPAYICRIDTKIILQNAGIFGILSNYISNVLEKFTIYKITAMSPFVFQVSILF